METLPIEYVLRTSLIAAVIAMVLYVMRIKTAAARHAAWTSVVAVMLLLPAWLAWGPRAALPILPRKAGQSVVTSLAPADFPVATPHQARTSPASPKPLTWSSATFLIGVYFLGLCVLLARLAIGTIRTIRLTNGSSVVPVTVGFFRPRIILPECSSEWPQARLDAVLIHEREHARRRDPLFQWLALLNRALFWFHPLAWWLERQISGLAEEACDTAVLAQGHDPHDYSEYLLDLSRSVELAGKRLNVIGMEMPGTFLPQRIRRMLNGVPAPRTSRPRMALTAAVCAAAAAILAAGTLVHAQSKTQTGPTFDVASVKPFDPSASRGRRLGLNHGSFYYIDSLFGLILNAYGVKGCGSGNTPGVDCALLSGGPAWIHESVFEIQAKTPDDSSGPSQQLHLMLQALLADRFKLKIHRETRQLAVFALTIGKNGPKAMLKMAAESEQPSVGFPTKDGTVQLVVKNHSLQELADILPALMGGPVLDKTGLKGKFDFTMRYEADADARGVSPLAGPSMLTAFQEQLGLRLESTKAPVEVLVIDHVEKPSAN